MRAFEMISDMIFILAKISVGLLAVYYGWKLLARSDSACAERRPPKRSVAAVVFYIVTAAVLFRESSLAADVLDILFWSSMALAALADFMTKEIHDICYAPALVTGAYRMIERGAWKGIPDLILFAASLFFIHKMYIIFRRCFGASDCIALWTCALYMTSSGARRWDYVYLTAITAVLAVVVQICKGNISRGRLKSKVALVPYIAVANLLYLYMFNAKK